VVHNAKAGRGALVEGAEYDAGDVLAAQGVRERAQRDVHRMTRSVQATTPPTTRYLA
jgi:hypothetical protein